MRLVIGLLLLCSFACGGSAKGAHAPGGLELESASLPYHIVQARTGRELSREEFYAQLVGKRAVCVGETHPDARQHWAQLTVVDTLSQRSRAFALGLEMFQRPFQGVLDDFAQGKISEEVLLQRSDWRRRWSHSWDFYAPTVRLTVERGGALVALNVSTELKDKWKKLGTEGLSESDRAKIPELDINDQEHRRWFRSLMENLSDKGGHEGAKISGHGEAPEGAGKEAEGDANAAEADDESEPDASDEVAPSGDFIDSIYPVQVLWDETMADSAFRWLRAGADRQMVILAGHGHCHDSGIVRRLQRRGVQDVVSVRPVVETGNGEVADLLSAPENDYLFVMDQPAAN